MAKSFRKKSPLELLLEASNALHKNEMRALYSEIARIKRAYIKKHGIPTIHQLPKAKQ